MPLTHHSSFFHPSLRTNVVSCSSLRTQWSNLNGIPTTPYEIISKRQKMSFKEFDTAVVCSGRAATGFAFASAILALAPFQTLSSTRHCEWTQWVKQSQKEFPLSNMRVLRAMPIAMMLIASPFLKNEAMTLSTEGEAVPASPPSASLTHSTNYRWWLFILSPFGA